MVAIAIILSWVGLTTSYGRMPTLVIVLGLAVLGTWYGSLQHEIIHGHLPTWVGRTPLGLIVPFCRYRTTHLDHHRNELLTDPIVDPESFYISPDAWETAGSVRRAVLLVSRTLVGRMVLGPLLYGVGFLVSDVRHARHNGHVVAWLQHLLGAAAVVVVLRTVGLPLWIYLLVLQAWQVVNFGCTISLGLGRTSTFGFLFVIFHFYIFIHQRLGADIAMNSLPAAIPDRCCTLYRTTPICKKCIDKFSFLFQL